MSDNENPTAPSKQTSSVPLKKETVRVTLKAADAPPAPTVAGAPVVRPPVAGAPAAPVAPAAPGAPVAPRPAGAPTIPLRAAGAAPVRPAPAPTVPLRPAALPATAGGVALPKATVQLATPTQQLTSPRTAVASDVEVAEEEEEATSGGSKALGVVALVAAVVFLAFQLAVANVWIQKTDSQSWGQLISDAS